MKSSLKTPLWILVLLLVASAAVNLFLLTRQPEVTEKRDTDLVVRWDTIHDSLPPEKGEKIVKYIRIPCSKSPQDSLIGDSLIQDSASNSSITLPVVQKTFSDDSTYTAWVSGPKVDAYPKLDSINVRQKIIERNITVTLTEKEKERHWRFGLGVNAGISVITGKPDITAGFQAGYTW